jgi:hypothetical protein
MPRSFAIGVLASIGLGAALATAVFLDHGREEIYAIPGWALVLGVALAGAAIAGCVVAATSDHPVFALAALLTVALTVAGVVSIFSVGLLLLALAAGVAVVAARMAQSSQATIGAVLVGFAVPLLALFALSGPVVECGHDGSSSGENLFMAFGSGSDSGSSGTVASAPGGDGSGSASGPGYAYTFECRDSELVAFELHWR